MALILPIPFGSPEYDELVGLRIDVLRKPLGLEFSLDFLAKEYKDVHLAAYSDAMYLLGGLILSETDDPKTVQMRQVAVRETLQRQGIGRLLVAEAERHAQRKGYTKMTLHARVTAVPFYLQQQYTVCSDEYIEVGIPHFSMYKNL